MVRIHVGQPISPPKIDGSATARTDSAQKTGELEGKWKFPKNHQTSTGGGYDLRQKTFPSLFGIAIRASAELRAVGAYDRVQVFEFDPEFYFHPLILKIAGDQTLARSGFQPTAEDKTEILRLSAPNEPSPWPMTPAQQRAIEMSANIAESFLRMDPMLWCLLTLVELLQTEKSLSGAQATATASPFTVGVQSLDLTARGQIGELYIARDDE